MGGVGGALLSGGPANRQARKPLRLTKPTTRIILALGGVPLAGLFDGLPANPRYNLRNILALAQHPGGLRCAARNGKQGLTWADRILGTTVVHAQECIGLDWTQSIIYCNNNPPNCNGGSLQSTEDDPDEYYGGFISEPSCCPGTQHCSCGEAYPWCYNGGS